MKKPALRRAGSGSGGLLNPGLLLFPCFSRIRGGGDFFRFVILFDGLTLAGDIALVAGAAGVDALDRAVLLNSAIELDITESAADGDLDHARLFIP